MGKGKDRVTKSTEDLIGIQELWRQDVSRIEQEKGNFLIKNSTTLSHQGNRTAVKLKERE